MFDPFSITGVRYDELQTLNQLQAYNTWICNDEMLDLMREIQASGDYYWQGLALPDSSHTEIGAQETFNGSMQVPIGTYITGITYYTAQPEGFNLKIFDKGTKASIFYGDFQLAPVIGSDMLTTGIYQTVPSCVGSNEDKPFGPNLLISPFVITKPGVLGWELTNKSIVDNTCQVMLSCAVPITVESAGVKVINRG